MCCGANQLEFKLVEICSARVKKWCIELMFKRTGGFTLIELLVTIAIVGIVLGSAVPSFNAMIARNKMATQANDILTAINAARSEALKIGSTVSLQAIVGTDADNEFGPGYCVIEGNPGNCTNTAANRLVVRFPPLDAGTSLDSLEDVTSIQFNSIGGLTNIGADNLRDLELCNASGTGRRIRINMIGRSKSYKPDPDVSRPTDPGC